MKRCRDCGEEKPLDEFHVKRDNKDGRQSYCKPCMTERNRRWNDNPRNLASRRAATRRYQQKNPEVQRVHRSNSRARAKGREATLTVAEWLSILEKHGKRCAYCGDEYETLDHVLPLRLGGGSTANNVLPSCGPCNYRKNAKDVYQRGYDDGYKAAMDEVKRARARTPLLLRDE